MAWYKTGTISVTTGQTSVTGVGTKFASNARVGDGFRGPDGDWYEIVNIASETVLGIYPAYAGATVSASAKWTVAPIQGYNKDSGDRLRAITDNISATIDSINNKQDKNTNLTAISNSGTPSTPSFVLFDANGTTASMQPMSDEGLLLVRQATPEAMQTRLKLVPVSSRTDQTAGRLITPGWQGYGSNCIAISGAGNVNALRYSGNYYISLSSDTPEEYGFLQHYNISADGASQDFISIVSGLKYTRKLYNGTWSAWRTMMARGEFGIGTTTSPTLPGANANQQLPAGLYATTSQWTGSAISTGLDGNNQGYLMVHPWQDSTYVKQTWTSIYGTWPTFTRYMSAGTWGAWTVAYDSTNILKDPALGIRGGLISSTVVSGFVVSKFVNGQCHLIGPLPNTPSIGASAFTVVSATVPAVIVAGANAAIHVQVSPTQTNDFYGVTTSYENAASGGFISSIGYVVRNGNTAQNFGARVSIWGKWS